MEHPPPVPAEASDAPGVESEPFDRAPSTDDTSRRPRRSVRPGAVACVVMLAIAAAIGVTWPEIADGLQARGIGHPDRVVEIIGCCVLWAAAAMLLVAARRGAGRRSAALALAATGAAVLATATAAMALGPAPLVGFVASTGPTTLQIVGIAILLAAICAVPSSTRWSPVLAIDAVLGAVAAISLTWLAPLRTSSGPGGGLADVVAREHTAAVLIAMMVAGVVLLVRIVGSPGPGDLALAVSAMLIPSALYVSLVGQFAGHAAVALRTSSLWWMVGPGMLLLAARQAVQSRHGPGQAAVARGGDEAVAATATLLSLGAVATHRLFIATLDPVMLALGVATVLLSTTRLALSQREQSRLQDHLGVLAATLHQRARTDELTGLGNRLALTELLEQAHASGQTSVAAFYADVDEFKSVNDAFGHDAGDRLLVGTALRLVDVFGPDVHRVGGDEFVAVCTDLSQPRVAALAATAVERSREPLAITDGLAVPARLSIGAALLSTDRPISPARGDDETDDPDDAARADASEDEVVRMSDIALNRAKELGRNRAVVYDDWLSDRAHRRAQISRGLCGAVDREELEVRYRPVVGIVDGRVSAAEAIIRWRTPEGRLLLPDDYLGIAADTGMVPTLSRLGQDLASAPWQASEPFLHELVLVMSVTRHELVHVGYVDDLTESIGGLRSGGFRLQIAEPVLMDPAVRPTVDRLIDARVPICVREFGTAASSLRRLHGIHEPSIRLDRSFATGLEEQGPDTEIVRTVAALGAELGVSVVADGVTRSTQVDRLRDLGIDHAQGWLFGPPTAWSTFAARHLDTERTPSALEWRPPSRQPASADAGGPGTDPW